MTLLAHSAGECARRAAQSPAEETLVEGRFGFFLILSRTTIRILKDKGSDDHLLDVLAHQSAGEETGKT